MVLKKLFGKKDENAKDGEEKEVVSEEAPTEMDSLKSSNDGRGAEEEDAVSKEMKARRFAQETKRQQAVKRELEEKKQAIKEAEDESGPKVYPTVGSFGVSEEPKVAVYLILKALAFMMVGVGAMYVMTASYGLPACSEALVTASGEAACYNAYTCNSTWNNCDALDGNPQTATPNIYTACVSWNGALTVSGTTYSCPCPQFVESKQASEREGCTINSVNGDSTCRSKTEFDALCVNPTSCPSATLDTLNNSLIFFAVSAFLMAGVAFLGAAGLMTYAGYHPDDFFVEMSRGQKCLMMFAKSHRYMSQWLICLQIVASLFNLYTTLVTADNCKDAIDSTTYVPGTVGVNNNHAPNSWPSDAEKWKMQDYMLYLNLFLYFIIAFWCCIGTTMAFTLQVRGELYSPSNDEEISCPDSVVCVEGRSAIKFPSPVGWATSEETACCGWITANCMAIVLKLPQVTRKTFKETCVHPCRMLLNLMFWPFAMIGYCIESIYMYRHFVSV